MIPFFDYHFVSSFMELIIDYVRVSGIAFQIIFYMKLFRSYWMDKYYRNHFTGKNVHQFLHNKYNDLLISDTFRLIALSMISIFVPIYLLKNGFMLIEIIIAEALMFLATIGLHYLMLSYLLQRIGIRRSIFISYICSICFYTMLSLDTLIGVLGRYNYLAIVFLLNGLLFAFYWNAHHIFFLTATKVRDTGKRLGLLKAIPTISGISGPFIGGILITTLGFKAVFAVSILLLVSASIALSFSNRTDVKLKLDKKKVLNLKNMKRNLIFGIQGINSIAAGFMWPIFLFLASVALVSIGAIYLLSHTVNAFMNYYGGKTCDSKGFLLGRIGAIGHGLSLIFRALSKTVVLMTTFQAMGGAFGGLLTVTLDSEFYKKSHKDSANSIMNRELYMHLGRICAVAALGVLLIFYNPVNTLIIGLVGAGIITFFLNILMEEKVFDL